MATSYSNNFGTTNENTFPQDFQTKPFFQNDPPATKRIALSTISDNIAKSNFTQKAVTRPCTNKVAFELVPASKSSFELVPTSRQSFAVYEDKSAENDKENSIAEDELSDSLPSAVTTLFKYQDQLQLSFRHSEFKTPTNDSPMVLDSTLEISTEPELDEDYPSLVYDESIYEYLKERETKFLPKPTYMRKQPDMTYSMRAVLVDWLVDVAESYKMHTPTVYLAVSYTDRFLSQMSVLRSKLQLVGTAAMFIASKYEEIYPPELKDLVYVTDDTYTKKQILRMEHLILRVLAFDVSTPTAYDFLERYCHVTSTPEEICCLAKYICELSLLEGEAFLIFLPSVLAASSLYLANITIGYTPWGPIHEEKTGYVVDDLTLCLQGLYKHYCGASELPYNAIREKYKSSRYHCVADIQPPQTLFCRKRLGQNV